MTQKEIIEKLKEALKLVNEKEKLTKDVDVRLLTKESMDVANKITPINYMISEIRRETWDQGWKGYNGVKFCIPNPACPNKIKEIITKIEGA